MINEPIRVAFENAWVAGETEVTVDIKLLKDLLHDCDEYVHGRCECVCSACVDCKDSDY